MLSRCAVEIHTLPVNPGVFPRHPPFEGLLKPAFMSQRHTDGPPNIRDTSGISGNVFAHPQTSSSAPYPQELNSTWKKTIEEPIHMSTAEKSGRPERDSRSEMPIWTVSQRFSHPSVRGDSSKNYGADQQRLQISDLHFDKLVPYTSNLCLLEDKVQDRGMYLFTISFGSNAMDQRSGVG